MAATIYDIAAKAGVSASTVSRALRGDPRIGEKTMALVRKYADELEYIPNATARSLLAGQSKLFGLLLPSLIHQIELEPSMSLSRLARQAGFDLMITLYHHHADAYERMLERLAMLRVDGIFVLPPARENHSPMVERLVRRHLPLVFIDRSPCEADGRTTTVSSDNETGARRIGEAAMAVGADTVITCFADVNSVLHARRRGIADFLRPLRPDSRKVFLVGAYDAPVLAEAARLREKNPGLRFSAGVFDAWNSDLSGFEEIFVMPQNFSGMTESALDIMLKMLAAPQAEFPRHLQLPAMELVRIK